jgi:DNA polymerase III subunit delta
LATAKPKSKAPDALTFLAKPESFPIGPVCVAFGDDPFLKRQVLLHLREAVLTSDEADYSFRTFDGPQVELAEVLSELATYSMFGDDRRLIVVEEADDFVSRYRNELEDYLDHPRETGVLLLLLKTFPSNTRLAKAAIAGGLVVDCKSPSQRALVGWAIDWAAKKYQAKLDQDAAEAMVDLVGAKTGLIDQELAKLASSIDEKSDRQIDLGQVMQVVGSWRTKTTWEMLDAALAGQLREAISQLDRLLVAGEMPIAILGQISASLRRFAAATRLILQAEATGKRPNLSAALQQAGIRQFVLNKAADQLRRLGRKRGAILYRLLLEADLGLKGASSLPPRLVLERLLIRLSDPNLR